MPVEMEPAAFDALVDRALDEIPDEIAALVHNVVVLVEDQPPPDEPDLLGLYEGVALTERWGVGMDLPDRILVFRGPLLDLCDSEAELVEDRPPPDEPDLLGLYEGVALTERWGVGMELPDRILVFRRPLLDLCDSEAELVEEVRITVVHEIAHHFGIDDERLHRLGYG